MGQKTEAESEKSGKGVSTVATFPIGWRSYLIDTTTVGEPTHAGRVFSENEMTRTFSNAANK
jgi:hypothetical protein